MMEHIGTAINWIFSLPFIKSSYFIFFGSLAVVIGGWRNTYEQNIHNDSVTSANKQVKADTVLLKNDLQTALTGIKEAEEGIAQTLVEIDKTKEKIQESANYLTGGDAYAVLADTGSPGIFMVLNKSSKYPLEGVKVTVTEYWWPDDGKELPADDWTFNAKHRDALSLVAPYRTAAEGIIEKLYPNEGKKIPSTGPGAETKADSFDNILYPSSHVAYYSIDISSAYSSNKQHQAVRVYKSAKGNKAILSHSLHERHGPDGFAPFGVVDERWKKILPNKKFKPGQIRRHVNGDYYYQWEKEFEGRGGEIFFRDW